MIFFRGHARGRNRGTAPRPQLNMTPMIDVVFLLLIFFVLTARFRLDERTLDHEMPAHGTAAAAAPEPTTEFPMVRIRIAGEAEAYRVTVEQAEIPDIEELRGYLRTLHETGDRVIVIDAAEDVPYQYVIDVLDAAVKAGFSQVGFAA